MLDGIGIIAWLSSTDSKNYLEDLEKITKNKSEFILFVDDYSFYLDLLMHYAHLAPKNIKLVLSERFTNHRRLQIEDKKLIQMREFVVDRLCEDEIRQFSNILQTTALDIKKAGKSEAEKMYPEMHDEIRSNSRG